MKKGVLFLFPILIFLGACTRDTMENYNRPLSSCEEISPQLKTLPKDLQETKYSYKMTIWGLDGQSIEKYRAQHPNDQIFRFKDGSGHVKCLIFTNDYNPNPGSVMVP
jgi:hypothetical protein